jgi:hypothetical protein
VQDRSAIGSAKSKNPIGAGRYIERTLADGAFVKTKKSSTCAERDLERTLRMGLGQKRKKPADISQRAFSL